MPCSCRTRDKSADAPVTIHPLLPCVFCAQKHFATAMQLAMLCGYTALNRTAIIGLLVLAQWHLYRKHYNVALLLRDIRHMVQNRKLDQIKSWTQVALLIDKIVTHLLELSNADT